MEQLNKIELRGNIGFVRTQMFSGARVCHFTVATNYVYKDRAGEPVIETTWHNVTVWEGKAIPDISRIVRGAKVNVVGRIKSQHYTDSEGQERYSYEVQASRVGIIENDEQMSYEMM